MRFSVDFCHVLHTNQVPSSVWANRLTSTMPHWLSIPPETRCGSLFLSLPACWFAWMLPPVFFPFAIWALSAWVSNAAHFDEAPVSIYVFLPFPMTRVNEYQSAALNKGEAKFDAKPPSVLLYIYVVLQIQHNVCFSLIICCQCGWTVWSCVRSNNNIYSVSMRAICILRRVCSPPPRREDCFV